MESFVLIPQEFALAITSSSGDDLDITVWTTMNISQGSIFYPFQGTIRYDRLNTNKAVKADDIRYAFGLYDDISNSDEKKIRYCNWVRFLRISSYYDSNVNMVCSKVGGDPIYEVIKPITAHQELVAFILPDRPENQFCMKLNTTRFLQTMDSILQESPLDLSASLLISMTNLPISPVSSLNDSNGSVLTFYDSSFDNILNPSSSPEVIFCKNKRNKECQTPNLTRLGRRERSLLPCEICEKAFDRPSLLKRHMRTHTGEKPHICLICGKGFSTSSSLNTHRRIHSGEKPHECQVCGKRFTASSNLYYHRMTHIKEKPHKCNLCAKSFPTPGDLKSHMYVHSGTWPFKCQICLRGFSKQTNLKNHLFLHTGRKPYSCQFCSKKFALTCNLRAHIKTHVGFSEDECFPCEKTFRMSKKNIPQDDSTNCVKYSDTNYLADEKTDNSEEDRFIENESLNGTNMSSEFRTLPYKILHGHF